MTPLKNLLHATFHLFYPHLCAGCGSDILQSDNLLCLQCINNLPQTTFASYANNPIEKIFWGRISIVAAHSQFYFVKDSIIQHLIHQLKYKNNTAIGFYLGQMMGDTLLQSGRFTNIDFIIPLPLFLNKEYQRGYNQATIICNGISDVMHVPVLNGNVLRQRATQTQTQKHRTERWENVAESFIVTNVVTLQNKNILLVDDVITTGATLEACGTKLLQIEGLKLNIVSLAYATK